MATIYKNPNDAIVKAATVKGYAPTEDEVKGWISQFVPGSTEEKAAYNSYFDALIKLAKTRADKDEVSQLQSIKAAYNAWAPKHPLDSTDLSKSGGKGPSELQKQVATLRQSLEEATKNINSALDRYNSDVASTGAKGALTTGAAKAQTTYDDAYTALYGAAKSNFGEKNAAPKSLLGTYNAANAALKTAQDNLAANTVAKNKPALEKAVTTAQAAADKAKTAYDAGTATLTKADTGLKDATKALNDAKTDLASATTGLRDTYFNAQDAYTKNVLNPYTAFITNTPVPVTNTNDEKVAAAVDFYKKNGYIDPTWANNNPTLVPQVNTLTEQYEQKKAQDAYAAKYSTATDLAGALKDYAEKKVLPDSTKNAELYNQVIQSIAKGINSPDKLQPNAPTTPSAPVTPTTPSAPVTPTTPSAPVTPTTPAPVTPTTPSAPVTPAPVTPAPNNIGVSDVITFLNGLKNQDTGGLDLSGVINYLSGSKKDTITTPAISATPTITTPVNTPAAVAPKKEQVEGNVRINLPTGYNDRSLLQDMAARQEMLHPGTYATGQFDPFYSGYLSDVGVYSQTPSAMNPNGTFANGPGYVTPSTIGLGFQNAYNPSNTTGAAAGGYMDAQVINQQNQALQQPNNQTLGLGAIPNMSQYRDYQNNPGITSSTQIGDDGNVGGVPVPGQTTPIW